MKSDKPYCLPLLSLSLSYSVICNDLSFPSFFVSIAYDRLKSRTLGVCLHFGREFCDGRPLEGRRPSPQLWWMMAQITPPLSFLLLGKRESGLEVSLRLMDELSPHCPSGTVSFCQTFTPVLWSSFSRFLETGEALDDYAKFSSSLMGTYASLTMSIASDNKALMGWHCGDELERLKSYNVAANVRSSMKHDDKLDELLDEFQLFNVTTDPVGENVWRYSLHLKRLHFLHQLYAYRKALAKLDFIKCDSDFDEVFQRLKSEKQWTAISDGTLRHALAQHFSLLRKLIDDLGMIGLASASKMPEGDKLLEAIENEYSQKVSDSIKDFKERNMRDFFSDHMEAKILQRKLFDQAESSRTVMLPKECQFTSPKLSPLIDRALVHRSRALEKFLELKGRWGRSIGGLRSKLWPVAVVLPVFLLLILVVLILLNAEGLKIRK